METFAAHCSSGRRVVRAHVRLTLRSPSTAAFSQQKRIRLLEPLEQAGLLRPLLAAVVAQHRRLRGRGCAAARTTARASACSWTCCASGT